MHTTDNLRRRHIHTGQSLVEFALSASLLIMLLLGTVDFARGYAAQVSIKNAVAEAGYYAVQNPRDDAGIRNAVRSELAGFTPAVQNSDITITRDCTPDVERTTIQVRYQYNLLFTFLVPSATVTLGSETTVPQMGGC
ncbi:MAG TPA: TadE/TadG family type IV pilus assembly protein [Roseiflexaceae bacterium]|nr:TadE/TadG family type IV pilus assembly protein [Roseiflexaceae bacterium]HMP39821.1 TadE/TadG family type IV pilus assembly protein [Roseiflexaceae bacterium]